GLRVGRNTDHIVDGVLASDLQIHQMAAQVALTTRVTSGLLQSLLHGVEALVDRIDTRLHVEVGATSGVAVRDEHRAASAALHLRTGAESRPLTFQNSTQRAHGALRGLARTRLAR